MKSIKIVLIIIIIVLFSCKDRKIEDGAIITSDKIEHDYGTIKQYSKAESVFIIKNMGNKPLIIEKISSSCGCTVPSLSDKTINPQSTSIMTVRYNTNKTGEFRKTVVIKSNAKNKKNYVIKIKGEVEKY